MSNDQINVTIAQHMGWVQLGWDRVRRNYLGVAPGQSRRKAIPDFCRDRNAAHQAFLSLDEDAMGPKSQVRCLDILSEVLDDDSVHGMHMATARQWAEAVVRTLGKWW